MASKYVITAAHCVEQMTAEQLVVRIGDHNLLRSDDTTLPEKTINVRNIANHPVYKHHKIRQRATKEQLDEYGHDIAILELEEEVDLNIYTPACLATMTDLTTFDNKTATIAGWGAIDNQGGKPNVPYEVDVTVNAKCHPEFSKYAADDPSIMCVGKYEGKGSCSGDSGGPVTFMSGDQHILIGAVSFGSLKGCGLEMGSAHCRISNVRAWIDLNTLDAVFCGDNPHADEF